MLFITSNTLFGSQKQFLSRAILQMHQLHLGRKFETTIDVFMCICVPAPQSGQNVCFAFFGAMFSRGSEYDATIFSTQKIFELNWGFGKILLLASIIICLKWCEEKSNLGRSSS